MVQIQYINKTNVTADLSYDYDTYLIDNSGNTGANGITLTLPLILSDGMCYNFKRTDMNDITNVTIQGTGGQNINGNPSLELDPLF